MNAEHGRIVVGVDGSPASFDALRWAAKQAELTGASLEAVTSWSYPTTYGFPVIANVDWEQGARAVLEQTIADALGETGPPVRRHVVEGHPAQVLAQASEGADLLVVGSRGHGGFAGLLLGSVSEHVVAHAPCPVVVVRHCAAGSAGAT